MDAKRADRSLAFLYADTKTQTISTYRRDMSFK
jgi:hypothetical protein